MTIFLILLLSAQKLTWYEVYERGEKRFKKSEYEACIEDMNAALALKPEPKRNQFTRAVQKIDYKPYYYLALAHFKLDRIPEAYTYSQEAYAGEVVRESPLLQSELAAILDAYREEVAQLHQQYTREQATINTRRQLLSLLADGNLDGVNELLDKQGETPGLDDIRLQLEMQRDNSQRTSQVQVEITQRVEQLLSDGNTQLAEAFFEAMRENLPEREQSRLRQRIDAAPSPPTIEEIQPEQVPVVEENHPEESDLVKEFSGRLARLESERDSLREQLTSIEASNQDLQSRLARERETKPEYSLQPFLALKKTENGALHLRAHVTAPIPITEWFVTVGDQRLALDANQLERDANDYKLNIQVPMNDYGTQQIGFTVVDELDKHATVRETINFHRPIYLEPGLWGGVLGLAVLILLGRLILIKQRQKRASMRHFNPYIAGSPVRDLGMFYGRDQLMRRIQGLVHKNSFMIFGARRIGKTSMLLQLRQNLAEMNSTKYRFFPAFIDLQGVVEEDLFHHMMAELLLPAADWHIQLDDLTFQEGDKSYQSRQFSRDIKRIIHRLREHHPDHHVQLVLLMDEVDVLNEFGEKTNQKLRGIFMKDFAEYLSCVMAGIHLKKEWDSSGSPWYNFFEQIPVSAFSKEDARELILRPVKGTFSYEREAVDLILEKTGCHPYLIQKICVSLIDQCLNQGQFRITPQHVRDCLATLNEEIQRNRNELYHQQMG